MSNLMLCDSVEDLSNIDRHKYIYEVKKDGRRAKLRLKGDKVKDDNTNTLFSKSGDDLTRNFPEFQCLKVSSRRCVVDGELVILKEDKCSLGLINARSHTTDKFKLKLMARTNPAIFYAFDIMVYNDKDVSRLPLLDRKALLNRLQENAHFKVLPYTESMKEGLEWCEHEEGMILKAKYSPYQFGLRSPHWLKYKNHVEKVVEFNKFENNKDNSITLTDGFHRVKCNDLSVAKLMMTQGKIKAEVQGLEFTEDGHIRMPVFKRLI